MLNDRDAVAEVRKAAGGDRELTVTHYLYFPRENAPQTAVASLREQGFSVECVDSADGVNWLVLARHQIVLDEAQARRHRVMFEALATQGGGEYDGWEAQID